MRRSISRIVKSATLPPHKEENQNEVRSPRRFKSSAIRSDKLPQGSRKKGGKYKGAQDAIWFYDPNAPVDGQTTMRGRVILEQEDNPGEEVILTLQNGMLHIQHMQSSEGMQATSIALQEAHIFPTSKKNKHGIQITFPVSLTQLVLVMERESEREEWLLALQHNSLAHLRLKLDELKQLQAKTEEELQQALKTSDQSSKQMQVLKQELSTQKIALARLMETYETMKEKEEAKKVALRLARHDLNIKTQEVVYMKENGSQQVQQINHQWNDKFRKTEAAYSAKIEELSQQVSDGENQLQSLSGNLETAYSEMHLLDTTRLSMDCDIRSLKKKCGELQKVLDETAAKLKDSEAKREEYKNAAISAMAQNQQAQQKIARLSQETQKQEHMQANVEDVGNQKDQLSTLQLKTHDMQSEVIKLRAQLQFQIADSERQINSLKETIKLKDQDINKIKTESEVKYDVLRTELRDKSSRLKALQKSLISARNLDDKLSAEINESSMLRQKVQDLEHELERQKTLKRQANERNTLLAKQNAQVQFHQEAAEDAQKEISTLQGKLVDYDTALTQAKKREEWLLTKVNSLEREMSDMDHNSNGSYGRFQSPFRLPTLEGEEILDAVQVPGGSSVRRREMDAASDIGGILSPKLSTPSPRQSFLKQRFLRSSSD
eukprot:TRINITY_DN2914_c0_g1_i6.p1 TRINITY_DN2914_c0_g1~~TRINITY_DN2914_c0_g1_i6.p1  ORF type:complete len:663 (-),score=80.29 TRINITY_DN2914_c0_g1_i6:59-2047(-)